MCINSLRKLGAVARAKANSATAIPELIQIATNPKWEENRKEKHNIYSGCLLVNHAENGKKYLYDILSIKKETSNPQQ